MLFKIYFQLNTRYPELLEFPQDYQFIGFIEASDLEDAYYKTQHGFFGNWATQSGVSLAHNQRSIKDNGRSAIRSSMVGVRSSMVGDIFVLRRHPLSVNEVFRVASSGFEILEGDTWKPIGHYTCQFCKREQLDMPGTICNCDARQALAKNKRK